MLEHASSMMRQFQLKKYMRDNKIKTALSDKEKRKIYAKPLPFVMGCDLQSSPDGAAYNLLVGQEITHSDLFHPKEVEKEMKEMYKAVENHFEAQVKKGALEPLINNLASVYMRCPHSHGQHTSRSFTRYSPKFHSMCDHLFYNHDII